MEASKNLSNRKKYFPNQSIPVAISATSRFTNRNDNITKIEYSKVGKAAEKSDKFTSYGEGDQQKDLSTGFGIENDNTNLIVTRPCKKIRSEID